MKKLAFFLLLTAVGLAGVSLFRSNEGGSQAIHVVCAAELKDSVSDIAEQYRAELGLELHLHFGEGPYTAGDLLIAADPIISLARTNGLIREVVPLLRLGAGPGSSAAVLDSCQAPGEALKFARYLAAPEKGGTIFAKRGLQPVSGDAWHVKPELILYSGGVNRPAIEALLKRFAKREAITLTTVFNGCGILCASMKTMADSRHPQFPDAYYACDLCFIPPVAEQFPEAVLLTETDIGIAVKKGNPLQIRSLADLAGQKLRLGLCNAEQSTLGYMTRGMLKSSALLESIRKNVAVEVPTADFLINQMRVGALDAAIVYRVNWQLQEKHLDFVPIRHQGARAVQPFSVRADSPNRQLAGRLLAFLKSHPEAFTDSGFLWRGDEPAIQSKDIKVPAWLINEE